MAREWAPGSIDRTAIFAVIARHAYARRAYDVFDTEERARSVAAAAAAVERALDRLKRALGPDRAPALEGLLREWRAIAEPEMIDGRGTIPTLALSRRRLGIPSPPAGGRPPLHAHALAELRQIRAWPRMTRERAEALLAAAGLDEPSPKPKPSIGFKSRRPQQRNETISPISAPSRGRARRR